MRACTRTAQRVALVLMLAAAFVAAWGAGAPSPAAATPSSWTLSLQMKWVLPGMEMDGTTTFVFPASASGGPVTASAPFSVVARFLTPPLDQCTGVVTGTDDITGHVQDAVLTFDHHWGTYTATGACPWGGGSMPWSGDPIGTITLPLEDGAEKVQSWSMYGQQITFTWRLSGREEWRMAVDAGEVMARLFPSMRNLGGLKVDWRLVVRFAREDGRWTSGTGTLAVRRTRPWRHPARRGTRVRPGTVLLPRSTIPVLVRENPAAGPRALLLKLVMTRGPRGWYLSGRYTLLERGRPPLVATDTRHIPVYFGVVARGRGYRSNQIVEIEDTLVGAMAPRSLRRSEQGDIWRRDLGMRVVRIDLRRTG